MADPNLKICNDNVPNSIDYAYRFMSGYESQLGLISGWVCLGTAQALIALDNENQNPSLFSTIFWSRPDVDVLCGPCLSSMQRGYGFMGTVTGQNVSSAYCAVAVSRERFSQVAPLNFIDHKDVNSFIQDFLSIPVPWSDIARVYSHISPQIIDIVQTSAQVLLDVGIENVTFGQVSGTPEFSILLAADNVEILATQIAALADERETISRGELIVIIKNLAEKDNILTRIVDLLHLFNLPVKVAWTRGDLSRTLAFNIGSSISNGMYLIFIAENTIPDSKSWIKDMIQQIESGSGVVLAVGHAADIFGNIQAELLVTSDCGISREQLLVLGEGPAGILCVPRSDFCKYGGFDDAYLTGAAALKAFCMNIISSGGKIVYCTNAHATVFLTTDDNILARRARIFDNEVLRMKMCQDSRSC